MKLRFLLLFLILFPLSLPAQSAPETGKPFVVHSFRLSPLLRSTFVGEARS